MMDTGGPLHVFGGSSVPFGVYSLGSVGIAPYIYALLIISFLPAISRRGGHMQKTVEGRLSLARWTRALAVLLSLGQAYGVTVLIEQTVAAPINLGWFPRLAVCLELAGGTVIAIWLADSIDEHGLGFGYGALLLFVLRPVVGELHRLADYAAYSWSLIELSKSIAIWTVASVAVVVATVAVVRAVRAVPPPAAKKSESSAATELPLLQSGVLRPTLFAAVLMSLPVYYAGSVATSHPQARQWIYQFWGPYGTTFWTVLYGAIATCVVIALAMFVVKLDHLRAGTPNYLRAHIMRLAFLGGCFLALTVEMTPSVELAIARGAGPVIPLSGVSVVLTVVVVMAIVGAASHRADTRSNVASALL